MKIAVQMVIVAVVLAAAPACRESAENKSGDKPASPTAKTPSKPSAKKKASAPKWVEYTLMDGETVIQTPRNWISVRSEEDLEDQIGWLSSDYGKGHIHRVYRMNREDVGESSVKEFAETMLGILTDGDEVLSETDWLTGDSHGGETSRKITHLMTDMEGEGEVLEDAWLVFEAKDFGEFFHVQTSYHPAPLAKDKLKEITTVMDTLRPEGKEPESGETTKKEQDTEADSAEEKQE